MLTFKRNERNVLGKKFNRLTVLRYSGKSNESSGRIWVCKCDCGKITNVATTRLVRGITRSCGCLAKEVHSRRMRQKGNKACNWKGVGEIGHTYFNGCKRHAKERGWKFRVDMKYMWELFLTQNRKCVLSGIELKLGGYGEATASLDRIDSTKDYVRGNLQWVHKDINRMKQEFTEDKFIQYCRMIAANTRDRK